VIPQASRLQFGAVTVIPEERVVLKDGRPVLLTPKAFDLLAYFAANSGRLLTKDELMRALWRDATVEESNLAYTVFAVRKALGEERDGARYIETVSKSGYRFVARVVRIENAPVEPDAVRAIAADATPAASVVHFLEPVWGRMSESGLLSVSPNGLHVIFATEGEDGVMRLWDRRLDAPAWVPVPGGDVNSPIVPPLIWSPDSRFLVVIGSRGLKKVSLSGGAPQTICAGLTHAVGGDWSRDDVVLLGNGFGGVLRSSASGEPPAPIVESDRSLEEIHLFPSFLSDGKRFIYLRVFRAAREQSAVYVRHLDAPAADAGKRLFTTFFSASFVASVDSRPALIVFARDGSLFAQRFDEERLELLGDPHRVADNIGSYLNGGYFAVSPTTLVYRSPDPRFQLTWFDRDGEERGRVGSPQPLAGFATGLALTRDGRRVVIARAAQESVLDQRLYLYETTRNASPSVLTSATTLAGCPLCSDERYIYASTGDGRPGVYAQSIDGDRQLLFEPSAGVVPTSGVHPTSVSADGRVVLFTTATDPALRFDVWVWTANGPPGGSPLIAREFDQQQAQLSPDGRAFAYVSNETGRNEVFVADFRLDPATGRVNAGESHPISTEGGFSPRWGANAGELFYLTADGGVMSVRLSPGPGFSIPTRLFNVAGAHPEWGVNADGSRFLFAVPIAPARPIHIVRNWQSALPD
jgi:DNA-binding winged helix-turn-helix (wHTH) protein/Tol biopolymer transport system component